MCDTIGNWSIPCTNQLRHSCSSHYNENAIQTREVCISNLHRCLILYTHRAVMSPENTQKPIRIYIGGLILGVNTTYMLLCFF